MKGTDQVYTTPRKWTRLQQQMYRVQLGIFAYRRSPNSRNDANGLLSC
jgi:hypothetical protein